MTAQPIDDDEPWEPESRWNDPAAAERFGVRSWHELRATVGTTRPLFNDFIHQKGTFMVSAPANSGKTTLLNGAALAATQGWPYLGRDYLYPWRVRAAFFVGEALPNFRTQIAAWEIHHGIELADDAFLTITEPIDFSDHRVAADVGEFLRNHGVGLADIDPLINYHDGDENDSAHMGRVMRGINIMREQLILPAVALVAHHANAGGGIRGSKAIRDLTDVIYLATPDGPAGLRLVRDKNKFGPIPDTLHVKLERVVELGGLGVQAIDSVVATLSQKPLLQAPRIPASARTAWDTIRDNSVTDSYTKSELSRLLVERTETPRTATYRVIKELVEAGLLVVSEVAGTDMYSPRDGSR